jgi:hypothetical protein
VPQQLLRQLPPADLHHHQLHLSHCRPHHQCHQACCAVL